MRRFFALIGATLGGWIGWYLGAAVSILFAFLVAMIGTGLGMYCGIRIAQRYS